MRIYKFITLLILVNIITTEQQNYRKIIHNTDPEAKCLDGSSPAAYLHQGSDTSNFIIYFNPGSFCASTTLSETLQNCYQMSKNENGTSKLWPETIQKSGILSTDPQKNKFASWTKVVLISCDGSLHQGSTTTPIKYKDAELNFRGANIVRSHFKWLLNNYKLGEATKIILGGVNEGGIAAFLWTNYLQSQITSPSAVYTVIDSGAFVNTTSTKGYYKLDLLMRNLFKVANVDQKTPNSICNRFKEKEGEQYKCLFLEVAFSSIAGKMLVIQSEYDSWMISQALQLNCLVKSPNGYSLHDCSSGQIAAIESYRRAYLALIQNYQHFSKNSAWSIACSSNAYTLSSDRYDASNQKVPESEGLTVRNAIQKFVENERISTNDQVPWPYNTKCAQ